ncbi:MAG: hypothetical protein AAFV72_00285 [Cyanobacteria bacterium J06635_1]
MASPFDPFANITVCFDLPSGSQQRGDSGNSELQIEQLICVAYGSTASLGQRQRAQMLPDGGELSRIPYQGYWIAPSRSPQALVAEQSGPAYVWRISDGFVLPPTGFASLAEYEAFVSANSDRITAEGKFVLAATPPGTFGVEDVLGDRFGGYLLTKVAWVDAV